jgi:hypothetical protein
MSSHPENDTRFLTQPRPPSFYDLKITAWAVGALVLISFAIDTILSLLHR